MKDLSNFQGVHTEKCSIIVQTRTALALVKENANASECTDQNITIFASAFAF